MLPQKNRNREEFTQLYKEHSQKPTVNITLNYERLNALPQRWVVRQGCSLSPLCFHIALGVLVSAIKPNREIKGTQNGKKERKLIC